jgi:cytochrome P450
MSTEVTDELFMPEIDFGTDPVPDLPQVLMQLQRTGRRVMPVRYFEKTAYLVLRHEDIAKTLADDSKLPAATQWKRDFDTAGKTLLHMEGNEHRKTKMALTPLFSPAAVRRWAESLLLSTANEIIDDFGSERELELHEAYNRRYGFNIISRILGIPVSREEELPLRDLVTRLIQHRERAAPPELRRERSMKAVVEMNAILKPLIAQRRAQPQDDLISTLMKTPIDEHLMDDDDICVLVRFLYLAGSDTTGLTLGNCMQVFLRDRTLYGDLLAHPEKREAAIDEAIRLYSVTSLSLRFAEKPVTIAGYDIPAESRVLFAVPAANRDAQKFDDPEEFKLGRNRNIPLSFGGAAHHCLGIHLARQEILVSVNQLMDRLPGLRLSGEPSPFMGTMFRSAPYLKVAFDDLLPARR